MIAFGLFLLLAVGIVAGFALASGADPATLNLLGFDIETTDRGIFGTGAVCALGLIISLRLIAIGWRRARRRRQELRELRSSVARTAVPLSGHQDDDSDGHPHNRIRQRDRDRDRDRAASDDDWDERDHFESTPHE